MKNEDKELLLKDLCSRLPYGVKVKSSRRKKPVTLSLDIITDFHLGCTVKPYLRPMSSMTEEEKDRYNSFINHFEGDNLPNYESDFVYANESHELVDWLNENHFDYRGLIPMRLALPAPDGMYNF